MDLLEEDILKNILKEPEKCKALPRELYDKFMDHLVSNEYYESAILLKTLEVKCINKTFERVIMEDAEILFCSDWDNDELVRRINELFEREATLTDEDLMERFGILFSSLEYQEQIRTIKTIGKILEIREQRGNI